MIRLAWRQFRAGAVLTALSLAALAAVVLATRPHLAHVTAADVHAPLPTALGLLVVLVPALIGAFWGAPLVAREYEAGTYRLVWTQRTGRTRWLVVKLAVGGGAAALAAGAVSALVTWWAAPLDQAAAAAYGTFDQRGIVPVGYALFAFALGVAAGLLTRRTLPAMTITLCGLLAARIAATQWVRPLAFRPHVTELPLNADTTGYGSAGNILLGVPPAGLRPEPPAMPDAWIQSVRVVDASGHPLPSDVLHATCPALGELGGGPRSGGHQPAPAAAQDVLHDCVTRIGATYHEAVTYQPAGRYWAFQWSELAAYLAATVLLCGYAIIRLRRR
jgi:hypothetical protein